MRKAYHMSTERHMVAIPNAKWDEIQRILAALPFVANTPSGFVLRAIDHEIERIWERYRGPPGIGVGPRVE